MRGTPTQTIESNNTNDTEQTNNDGKTIEFISNTNDTSNTNQQEDDN